MGDGCFFVDMSRLGVQPELKPLLVKTLVSKAFETGVQGVQPAV